MTLGAKRLRARLAAVLRQEGRGRRYGADLKRAVVEHAFARQGEGATIREIAGELGLSAGLLGKWLRDARLRLEKGRVPFAPGEPPPMPWRDAHTPAAESLVAGSSTSSPAAPSDARRDPGLGNDRRGGFAPQRVVFVASTLAEFLAGAVAGCGSIRGAAAGIGIPYSTLRGWLHGRYGGGADGSACDSGRRSVAM